MIRRHSSHLVQTNKTFCRESQPQSQGWREGGRDVGDNGPEFELGATKTNNFQTVTHLVSVSALTCLDLGQLEEGIVTHCPMRSIESELVSSDQTSAGSLKLKIILLRTLSLTRVANWWPLSVNFQIFCPELYGELFWPFRDSSQHYPP